MPILGVEGSLIPRLGWPVHSLTKAVVTVAGLATLCSGVGCLSCRHQGYAESLRVLEASEFPNPIRQRVHLFMMNGEDVFELGGMLTLRDELCRAGYSKVYYAQKEDVNWYYSEMRRLHRDEPDARMVLLGYGTSAARVTKLAQDAIVDQLPLDSVIYLDPSHYDADLTQALPVTTVSVKSHNWPGSPGLITTETIGIDAGHVSAPGDPATLGIIVRLMTLSASRVVLPSIENLPHLPLRDKLEPTPRGIDPATHGPPPPGWDYLRPVPRFVAKDQTPTPTVTPVPKPKETDTLPKPREVPK